MSSLQKRFALSLLAICLVFSPTIVSAQIDGVPSGGNPDAVAPSGLSYINNQSYLVGTAITTLSPTLTSTGGATVSYTATLPDGLSIDSSTGNIAGTPTTAIVAADYTITATNSAGNTTFPLNITVTAVVPSGLSYTNNQSYLVGTAITALSPTLTDSGGATVTYSATLPAGLSIDSITGNITGTPTTVTDAANYTITATNSAGNTLFALNITVTAISPSGLSYTNYISYPVGTAITTLSPILASTGGATVTYSSSPTLPAGLSINPNTGNITGTPTTAVAAANYTITATNIVGNATFALNISIVPILSVSQELPKPTHGNTFFMMPLFPELQTTTITDMGIRYEMDKMISQMGQGNLYHQMGVSCVYKNAAMGDRTCRLAQEKGMRVGVIFELQTHIDNNYFPFPTLNQDIRAYQWRLNGIDWYYSSEKGTGSVLYPGQTRDSGVITPSRLCTLVRNNILQDVATTSSDVLALMKKYPGVISINNAIIEEELATGGQNYDNYLGDYSPYAITEFRDWLRHVGIYDDVAGTYKGEGAQAAIVGTFLNINGALRSQFYDDPTPADANGTGVSFNTYFGTSFTTWSTLYYDLVAYPNPIPFPASGIVTDFNPTPQSGTGFTSGGFDAPRVRNVNSNFWNAWSWDVLDHGGAYPVGNPSNPAFGFRQQMVKNYIKDIFNAYAAAGFPTENMYPHQIPGEIINAGRLRSGGDPLWTGYLPLSNNTGITRFGYINPSMLTQYSPSWGIFEWHPIPNSKPTNQILHDSAFSNLNTYYKNGAHALFPGWWHPVADNDTTFPLADSKFADGIKDFMSPRKEQPYTRQDSTVPSYTPPQVLNVEVLPLDATTHLVRWPQEIWAEFPETWRMWSQLESFDVEQSTDSINWTSLGTTQGLSIIAANRASGTTYFYHVRASSKSALKGNWSSAVTLFTKLSLTPDSSAISALDSSFVNNITINSTNNTNTYAAGGGFTRVDNVGTSFQELFTNNNQAEHPADIRMTLNGTVIRNVGNQILVKFIPPSGATIDAVTFNYYANYDSSIVTLQVLDDANQLIWENNAKDTSNGYKGIHFTSTSTSFTFCLTMKQTSSSGSGWFAQVSGIKVIYTNTPYKTGNLITAQVTGVGIALNTVPSNYAQANTLYKFDAASDVLSTNQLTGITYDNGLFAATTNGTDPYAIFNLNQNIYKRKNESLINLFQIV